MGTCWLARQLGARDLVDVVPFFVDLVERAFEAGFLLPAGFFRGAVDFFVDFFVAEGFFRVGGDFFVALVEGFFAGDLRD